MARWAKSAVLGLNDDELMPATHWNWERPSRWDWFTIEQERIDQLNDLSNPIHDDLFFKSSINCFDLKTWNGNFRVLSTQHQNFGFGGKNFGRTSKLFKRRPNPKQFFRRKPIVKKMTWRYILHLKTDNFNAFKWGLNYLPLKLEVPSSWEIELLYNCTQVTLPFLKSSCLKILIASFCFCK